MPNKKRKAKVFELKKRKVIDDKLAKEII